MGMRTLYKELLVNYKKVKINRYRKGSEKCACWSSKHTLEMFYDRDILLIGRTEKQINIYLNLLYKEKSY